MRLVFAELQEWGVAVLRCVPGRIGRLLRRIYYRAVLAGSGSALSIGEHVEFGCPEQVTLGNEAYFVRGAVLRACGGASLKLGNRVAVNGNARLIADFGSIVVGNDVMIGPNVVIRASNHAISRCDIPIWEQGQTSGHIIIGDDVWIGANAVILPNVRVGCHVVVGAGAVVTRDIPDFAVVAGVPAVVLRYRNATLS